MKVTINIDCTPLEARQFFGLPDVGPMQEALLRQVQNRMEQGLGAMEPEKLLKLWLPGGLANLEQLQKLFWPSFAGGAPEKPDRK